MFVNSAIIKLRENVVYNNTYILFMMRHIVIVNSVVMKPHGKQNWRNIWGHCILDLWVIVYSVIKNKAKFWCTTTYQIYSWLKISGLFMIFTCHEENQFSYVHQTFFYYHTVHIHVGFHYNRLDIFLQVCVPWWFIITLLTSIPYSIMTRINMAY